MALGESAATLTPETENVSGVFLHVRLWRADDQLLYGITITMYWDEHPLPHFHARCGGDFAVFDIDPLQRTEGFLARDKERLVLEWAKQHIPELWEAWNACRLEVSPKQIAPLR